MAARTLDQGFSPGTNGETGMDAGAMKQQAVELTDHLLELASAVNEVLSGPETEAKREQLKAVCSSIRQLEKKGVPVPDDLRRIKADLTAALGTVDQAEEVSTFLGKRLLDVLDLLGVSVAADGGRRRGRGKGKRVSLADLLEAGVLRDGMRVVHRAKRSGHVHHGYVRSPGVIEMTVAGTKQRFDTPSGAGEAVTGRSTDGWMYWAIEGDDGNDVPLKFCRDRFRKEAKA